MSDYYAVSGNPSTGSAAASATMRAEFDLISAGFDKLPDLTTVANQIAHVNAGSTALVTTAGFTFDGTTLTVPAIANLTLSNGGALRTSTTAGQTALIQAYDTDTGPAYVTFGTLTAGTAPSFELDNTTLDTAIAKGTWTASGTWTIPDVTVAGTLTMSGTTSNIALGANFISYAGTDAGLSLDASNNATLSANLTVSGGLAYLNDTSNANMTIGLTINQGANDNEILAFKSSDVAHGMTTLAETDTYGYFEKASGVSGGLFVRGLSELSQGLTLDSVVTTEDATRSTAAVGPIILNSYLKSGTTATGMSANQNLVVISTAGTTRFIFDADGDSHQDVGTAWTNFDAHDDLQIMDALALTLNRDDPLRLSFVSSLEESRAVLERLPGKAIVTFNEDGHHFANMSRVTMLHHGAIRQLGRAHDDHEQRIQHLTAENARLTAKLNQLENRNAIRDN